MRFARLLVGLVLVGGLWAGSGCRPAPPREAQPTPQEEQAQRPPAPDPGAQAEAPDQVEQPRTALEAIAKPGTRGWTQAGHEPVAFGRKVDRALRELGTAKVEARYFFQLPGPRGGEMRARARLLLDEPDRFSLQYYLPETRVTMKRMVSDGDRSASHDGTRWTRLPEERSSPRRRLGEREVLAWPERFPYEMLRVYSDGTDAWTPILEAWSRGVGGYTVRVEDAEKPAQGTERPYYRVIASTEQGIPTTVEAVFDGARHLPVSVRVVRSKEEGEAVYTWIGRWAFGGEHEAEAFRVPLP